MAVIPGQPTATRQPSEEEVDKHMDEVSAALTQPALTTRAHADVSPLSMSEEGNNSDSGSNQDQDMDDQKPPAIEPTPKPALKSILKS